MDIYNFLANKKYNPNNHKKFKMFCKLWEWKINNYAR